MNIIFLDFDGVVNIAYWQYDENNKLICTYNYPRHGKVNDYQAIQWVSEFCEKYNYSIVVTSTWRYGSFDYYKCLYDSGLRPNIKIIGCTPILEGKQRGDEITEWLNKHSDMNIENYLIFDDDSDMTIHMNRLIKCNTAVGFTLREYMKAGALHKKLLIK